ncbi:hypothetical protein BKA70DRAFT_271939 [Coprinopsis sp. MPI-PUGE-AT-0042]|nr:hypothetical protein BKA70DRAFT_271939 [Coprinopsis sp. MPI-PUGE-AT-0042]
MEKMLVDLYGYPPSGITTMMDTQANADSNSRSVLLFSSTQVPTNSMDETDGMDRLIVTYDNLFIQDDELREMLVVPLPPGVKLAVVFGSCHSASLLDLEHFGCNRVCVPRMYKGKGKRRRLNKLNAAVRRAAAPLSLRRHGPFANFNLQPSLTHL